MKNLKLGLVVIFSFLCLCSTRNTYAQQSTIDIPDYRFTDTDIDKNNQSNIYFNTNGNSGYGLLFLGGPTTAITNPTTLTINGGDSITCNRQLRGYYSTNYGDFHLLPIDGTTRTQISLSNNITLPTQNITDFTGGLFDDCSQNGTTLDGVYGHIKRTIGELGNTQEIRAGIDDNSQTWKSESPLKIVYYEGIGPNWTLSGFAWDNLGKKSHIIANFPLFTKVQIIIPDEYFSPTTAIFSENVNEISFNDAGNNGYGLFILGTGIKKGLYTINSPVGAMSCNTQLNGYYTISFTDFGMFPLDQETLNIVSGFNATSGVTVTGGLYTDCLGHNNGVYGHIKWTYGINGSNTHEIRAGVNSAGNWINISPLEIIYSENFRNTNASLSGSFHSSLIKNSIVKNRFFGDMGLKDSNGNFEADGTLTDHHFYILYDDFKNNQINIYTKSSITGSNVTVNLTGYDINGQTKLTWMQTATPLPNQRSSFGFYGFKERKFPTSNTSIRSGTINVIMTNMGKTRSKTINFWIQPDKPKITISRNTWDCTTGLTFSASATENATLSYIITGSSVCDQTSNYTYTTYGGPISISDDSYNEKYICFKAVAYDNYQESYAKIQITGLDHQGPTVAFDNTQVYECTNTITWSVTGVDNGCANLHSTAYNFSTNSFGTDNWIANNYITLNFNQIGRTGLINKTQTVTVRDALLNTGTKTATLTILDILPTVNGYAETGIFVGYISGNYNFGNIFTKFSPSEGNCGTTDLTEQLKTCTSNATSSTLTGTNHNELLIKPNSNTDASYGTCTVVFVDNENSAATGYVTFIVDTKPPTFTNITSSPNRNSCSRYKTITAKVSEISNIYYYTGTNPTCEESGPYQLGSGNVTSFSLTFDKESDSGTYICYKAYDLAGNVSYTGSKLITLIDRTGPTFNTSGNFEGNTNNYPELYECETGFAEIIDVTQIGCATAHSTGYSWDGGSNYGINSYNSYYQSTTGQQIINIRVRDSLGNSSGKQIRFKRRDRRIKFDGISNNTIDLNDVIDDATIDPVQAFGLTGRGDCEYIVINTGTCHNVEKIVLTGTHNLGEDPDYSLTITPKDDTDDIGWCNITFKDCNNINGDGCDNTLNGKIEFKVKTKDYYVVLATGLEYSSGHIKDDKEPDISKIHLDISNKTGGFDISDKYKINGVKRGQHDNNTNWLEETTLDIDTRIDYKALDYSLCISGNFVIKLDEGFITDPAGNPSKETEIVTDQKYELRPHICVSGENNVLNNNTFEYTESKIRSGFDMIIYTTTGVILHEGTGDILCTGDENCPGFSCSLSGIVVQPTSIVPAKTCNNGEEVYGFENSYTLHIDPNTSVDEKYPAGHIYSGEQRFEWTGCKIVMKNTNCPTVTYTNINMKTKTSPYKFGPIGNEDFYDYNIGEAISAGSGDYGFFFYMSNPQFVNKGLVGNIYYEMDFDTGVADEFYHIEGTGIVNGYQETLKIKRPTYNYSNPRSYLFNFPYYISPDETN